MSYKVKIGGTVRVMGGRAEGFIHRIMSWFREDPAHAKYILAGDDHPKQRQDLLVMMVRKGIITDLVPILESLHNDICRLYIRRISAYVLRDPHQPLSPDIDIAMPAVPGMSHSQWVKKRYNERAHAMRFWITNCAKIGENYRDASWLLKNMRFEGWAPNTSKPCGTASCPAVNGGPYNEFKGFCKHEPVARFRQLMEFPIERFGVDLESLPQIEWPQPPEAVTGATSDLVQDAQSLQGDLGRWEEYYKQLVTKLQEFHQAVDAS
jgi:hypothetical protein